MLWAEILALFRLAEQIKTFKVLPPLETTVMDTVFKHRPQQPSALIPVKDIIDIIQTVPVIGRAGMPTPVGGDQEGVAFIEPLALNPSDFIGAAALNDMKTWRKTNLQAWLKDKQDKLRRIIRRSTEGIAATSLTGTISWPLQAADGTFKTYRINYGTPLTYDPAKKWDAEGITLADVYKDLKGIRRSMRQKGYGGKILYWAGSDVFQALLTLVTNVKSTIKQSIEVKQKAEGIDIGGFLIQDMDETYQDPQTKQAVDKVPADKLVAVSLDAGHCCYYCALDDLDAKLQPLPFFLKPNVLKVPSGIDVIGMSKPLPVVNPNGVCWAELATASG